MRESSRVIIRRAAGYNGDLSAIIRESIREAGLEVAGRTVLLKPNFVGLDPHGVINTHPAVVGAAREAFLSLGASSITLGDGPAVERDTEAILESMNLRHWVGRLNGSFVDLNLDAVHEVSLRTRVSRLKVLSIPKSVLAADIVVSIPRMKTHHWAGVTLSMKNMFGVVPGGCYGWPKNILHWAGITRSVLDINSTLLPDFSIVDGIVGMEGNGPIHGTPHPCGVLVMGRDPVAVDATCARVMGLLPERIDYLRRAGAALGHIREQNITQLGETIAQVRSPFAVLKSFERLRADSGGGRSCGMPVAN